MQRQCVGLLSYTRKSEGIRRWFCGYCDWSLHRKSKPTNAELSMWVDNYLRLTDFSSKKRVCMSDILSSSNELSPERSKLLTSALLVSNSGIRFAMTLRSDVQKILSHARASEDIEFLSHVGLKSLNEFLQAWLSAVFCNNALILQRITFESSSGLVLQNIANAEAVHRIRALSEMKNRLSNGRRCFALFHPSLPHDPLTFVHIALSSDIVISMRDIYGSQELENPHCAMYYSVNSPHSSLGGLDLAANLLKRAAHEIQRLHPSVTTHCTLSPIPGFMNWLRKRSMEGKLVYPIPRLLFESLRATLGRNGQSEEAEYVIETRKLLADLYELLDSEGWHNDEVLCAELKAPVTWLCAHYLVHEKVGSRSKGQLPYDAVARFHLRNGASLYQLNWLANTSHTGISTSAGLMVNYKYDLKDQDDNIRLFDESGGSFKIHDRINDILEL